MLSKEWQLELLKSKVISFWLTHSYLRRLGKRYQDHFRKMIMDLTDSYSQQIWCPYDDGQNRKGC